MPRAVPGTITVSAPASPRLLGGVLLPSGRLPMGALVEWASASGTEVIGWWQAMIEGQPKNGGGTINAHVGVVGGGTVKRLNTGTTRPSGNDGW